MSAGRYRGSNDNYTLEIPLKHLILIDLDCLLYEPLTPINMSDENNPGTYTEKKSTFEFILKALPLFTVIVIILGISNAIVFYKIFRINIVQFVSLSESALFSLDYIILCTFVYYLFAIIFFRIGTLFVNAHKNNWKYLLMIQIALFVFAGFLIYHYWHLISSSKSKLSNLLNLTGCVDLAGIEIILIVNWFYKWLFRGGDRLNRYFILSVLFLAILIVTISAQSALNTKYTSNINNTIITLKDSGGIIKTNSTLIYVGKVEKYYLLYDRIVETGMIINVDEVKKIQWVKNDSMRSDSYIDSLVKRKLK